MLITRYRFDVAAWVKANLTGGDDKNSDSPGAGLKIAGSDPNRPEDEGVGVVIASDKDEATRKMERDAQAELKRQQNALPSWHLKSTISGDLTALGIKESARAEAAVANGVGSTSNDEVLRGLGVVGMKPSQSTTALVVETKRESKPVTNPDADCDCLHTSFLTRKCSFLLQTMSSIMHLSLLLPLLLLRLPRLVVCPEA